MKRLYLELFPYLFNIDRFIDWIRRTHSEDYISNLQEDENAQAIVDQLVFDYTRFRYDRFVRSIPLPSRLYVRLFIPKDQR